MSSPLTESEMEGFFFDIRVLPSSEGVRGEEDTLSFFTRNQGWEKRLFARVSLKGGAVWSFPIPRESIFYEDALVDAKIFASRHQAKIEYFFVEEAELSKLPPPREAPEPPQAEKPEEESPFLAAWNAAQEKSRKKRQK